MKIRFGIARSAGVGKVAVMMAALALTGAAAQASFTASISVVDGGSTLLNGTQDTSGGLLVIGPTNVTINSPSSGTSEFTMENFTASSNSTNAGASAVVMGSSLQMKNTSTTVETLDVNLLDSGFASPSGPGLQVSSFGTVQWAAGDAQNSQDLIREVSMLEGIGYSTTIAALNLGGSQVADLPYTATRLGMLAPNYSFGNDLAVTLNPGDAVKVSWNSTVAPVPEPTPALLLAVGSFGALLLARRRQGKAVTC